METMKKVAAAIFLVSTVAMFSTFHAGRERPGRAVSWNDQFKQSLLLKVSPLSDDNKQPFCHWNEDNLVGRLKLNLSEVNVAELIKEDEFLRGVKLGGHWRPAECKSRSKVAVIIPFRNRKKHLGVLLKYLHPLLQKQKLDYRIFVIEQLDDKPFNKGKMMNVGFKYSQVYDDFDCFVFHDVDMIPEDERNDYGCPSSVRHMAPAVDKFNYKLFSPWLFGGVTSFRKDSFERVNGFPNRYYGWGAEDDDMFHRVRGKKLSVVRPPSEVGRYSMIKHEQSEVNNLAKKLLEDIATYADQDGLNSLNYKTVTRTNLKLYTLVGIASQMTEEEEKLTSAVGS